MSKKMNRGEIREVHKPTLVTMLKILTDERNIDLLISYLK